MGTFQAILEWGSAFMFKPCDSNHCCISAYQQWMSPFSASCLEDLSANLGYLRFGSSQRRWINVTNRNNASVIIGAAPISARIISWAYTQSYTYLGVIFTWYQLSIQEAVCAHLLVQPLAPLKMWTFTCPRTTMIYFSDQISFISRNPRAR